MCAFSGVNFGRAARKQHVAEHQLNTASFDDKAGFYT